MHIPFFLGDAIVDEDVVVFNVVGAGISKPIKKFRYRTDLKGNYHCNNIPSNLMTPSVSPREFLATHL